MKILFYAILMLLGIGAVAAVRLKMNKVLRFVLVLLCGLGMLTFATHELYVLSAGFEKSFRDYLGIGLIAPLSWFLVGGFMLLYAFARLKLDRKDSVPPRP